MEPTGRRRSRRRTSPRVVVVGSSNTDLVVGAPHVPRPGETLLGSDFVVVAGGKGANQAVAAARLGAKVTFVANIGRDRFGDASVAGFQREGIVVDFIRREDGLPSGVALIVVGDDGENSIVVAPGSNASLLPADVDAARDEIANARVVLCQLETPVETTKRALELGRDGGATTILNPAPARPLPRDLFPLVDWLTPNETEAAALTGMRVSTREEAERAGRMLLGLGVGGAIVTLGAEGALLVMDDRVLHVPAPKVTAIDTVAAGDAFNGALAVGLGRGDAVEDALGYANAVGALSVTKRGAQPSLPTREEVERFMGSEAQMTR